MIRITINTECPVFIDNKNTEVARILRKIATMIEAGEEVNWVHDVIGNRVAQVIERKFPPQLSAEEEQKFKDYEEWKNSTWGAKK